MAFEEIYLGPGTSEPLPSLVYPSIAGVKEPTSDGVLITPEVRRELGDLEEAGIDVRKVDVAPHFELPVDVQQEVDKQCEAIGRLPKREAFETLFDPNVHSAGATWAKLGKRAIALWALKRAGDPETHTIAPSIDPSVYDEPIFDGKSAHEVLTERHPRTAEAVKERYRAITTEPIEDRAFPRDARSAYLDFIASNGFNYLGSKDFLTGVLDSRAVDTRAIAAGQLALEHILGNPEDFSDKPLVTASLACGAAASMFELNELFAKNGYEIGKNVLVDNDPMALASAVALSRAYGMNDKADIHLQDIVGGRLTDYIEPHSVDIVDILGIVDYLPTTLKGYRAASNFIGKIVDIVRPGGIIVGANALLHRPQQDFFEKVWPTLQQRDPSEMVEIITDAGYSRDSIRVRVPQREGVYGVYGITVPREKSRYFSETRNQKLARKVLTLASKFNKY